MTKRKKLNYNALGFAEILVTIMFVGVVATILSRVAVSSLQNLVRDERLDKITQYASDSSALIQNIANQGIYSLKDEDIKIEIFPKDKGSCNGYYYLVKNEDGSYELAHTDSEEKELICAVGYNVGSEEVRKNCVDRNGGDGFKYCAIPSENEEDADHPQYFRYIHIDFPDDYSLSTTDYVTAQITIGQIDNVNNEPTSKNYVADYTLYTSVKLNATKASNTHSVSLTLKNVIIGNIPSDCVVTENDVKCAAGDSLQLSIEKDKNIPEGEKINVKCTIPEEDYSFDETEMILYINRIQANMSCTVSYGSDEGDDDDNSSLCLSKVDTLEDCLIYSDQDIRSLDEAKSRIASKATPNFDGVAKKDDGLLTAPDYSTKYSTTLDGTSFYYRGAVSDNWVSFAGYLWRVVRINGDGSIRMIYSGTSSNHKEGGTQIGTSAFSSRRNDSRFLGYMYQTAASNDTNSTIKEVIDAWYENNLRVNNYEYFLSDSGFCGDRTSSGFFYGGANRNFAEFNPSFACVNPTSDRYTLKVSGSSHISGTMGYGNNSLNYPIGLLTIDEVSYAGGRYAGENGSNNYENKNYYLYNGQVYWLMSPGFYDRIANGIYVDEIGQTSGSDVSESHGVRPVINLKKGILYLGGNGTEYNPYTVVAENTIQITPNDNLVYTGEPHELVKVENPQCDELYFSTDMELNESNYSSGTTAIPTSTTGSYTVYYYCTGNDLFIPESGSTDVVIQPEKPILTLNPSHVSSVSIGSVGSFNAMVSSTTNIAGTLIVISNNPTDIALTSSTSTDIISTSVGVNVPITYTPINANESGAEITVIFTPDDGDAAEVVTKKYIIDEIKYSVENTVVVSANNLTYTGNAQSLVSTSGAQGIVYYSTEEELTSTNYKNGVQTIPTATNAGTYVVYWYCTGKDEFLSASGSTTVIINKLSPVISFNPSSDSYIQLDSTESFVATVESSLNCNGTLTAVSLDNGSVAIASGSSSNITATDIGVSIHISYRGSALKTTETGIVVTFVPSDTENFSESVAKIFIVNEVRTDYLIAGVNDDNIRDNSPTFGNSSIQRRKIESIMTLANDTVPNNAVASWDVSAAQNGSIVAYVLDTNSNGMYELYIGENGGVVANPNSDFLFRYFTNLASADLSNLKTNYATKLSFMFSDDNNLSTITGISNWNVSNVIDMNHMFANCSSLTSLSLNNWNTSKVTSMDSMFAFCNNLTVLEIGSWNTGNVENMLATFKGCSSLSDLPVGNWNVSNVEIMISTFEGCSSLTSLSIETWNVSNVKEMQYMFYGCSSLSSLSLNSWNTSNVTNMADMFGYCFALSSLSISNWNVSKVKDMNSMFEYDSSLTSLDLTSWTTSSLTNMYGMFIYCNSLTSMDLSNWDTSKVTDMSSLFYWCSSLQTIKLNGWSTPNVTNMKLMFSECNSLKTIYADSSFVTTSVSDSEDMFYDCNNLRGGMGTAYSSSHRDKEYARIDAAGIPGYFTNGGSSTSQISCESGDTLSNCIIYVDAGSRDYNTATTTIKSKSARSFGNVSKTDEGLNAIADYSSVRATSLDGYSYYFRGAVEDNWVSFAGYLWRVVRINGDGSVRMIYSGTTSNHTGTGTQIGTSVYNSSYNNAKYIGYTYDNDGTEADSTIKGVIDIWYANNLRANYESYLSNEIFCDDRSGAERDGDYIKYAAGKRLSVYGGVPTLECINQSDRYTLKVSGLSSIGGESGAGNNLLDYPIGLLTVDEAVFAGGMVGQGNDEYYLHTGQHYWLNSSFHVTADGYAYMTEILNSGHIISSFVNSLTYVNIDTAVRPVINLKHDILWSGGDGTETNPYTVQLPQQNPTLGEKIIMDDQGASSYSSSLLTAIQNKSPRNFSTAAYTDEGLHAIADYSSVSATSLDGTSYYYRGAVEDNWVSFAEFLWRIVRINGDGSVRLIYSGTTTNHTGTGTQIGTSAYNSSDKDPKYVGYTYDNNGTETDSIIKAYIDDWYENNLRASYENYLSNEIFCNDRSVGSISGVYTYYGAYTRVNTNKSPSLLCTNQSDRYTLKVSGQSSIAGTSGAGNNLLDYPVGLLTADEASFAGYRGTNSDYYLHTYSNYWFYSPSFNRSYNNGDNNATVFVNGNSPDSYTYNAEGVRPVLNLKPSVKWNSGNGTEGNPYTITL